MTFSRSARVSLRVAVPGRLAALLPFLILAGALARSQILTSNAGTQNVTLQNSTLVEYRQHLERLDGVVTDCVARQKVKSGPPANDNACDPARVGPDDRVSGAVRGDPQPREVRYDWLRAVLARAGNKSVPWMPSAISLGSHKAIAQPAVDTQLADALARLKSDEQQAASPADAGSNYAGERKALTGILSQKAYQGVTEVSAASRFREWLYAQLDRFLSSLVRFGARSPWIVWTLRVLLLLGICVGLVWIFVRIERGSRLKLVPDDVAPASGSPSAREWQLWLKDAQAMATKAQWRDAIHFMYWAAIARLESNPGARRPWPADRARTPREYLGLMPGADSRKPALTALTHSFERTWYGGRPADPADFNAAMEQAATLGVKTE
ncbi:MAG: DUF4129 domain-containing protein [Terracidiphilus sp.]|jgi:hypothetical protein